MNFFFLTSEGVTIHALLISQYKAVQLAYGENFDYFWVYLEEFGVFWGILSIFFSGILVFHYPPWPTLSLSAQKKCLIRVS